MAITPNDTDDSKFQKLINNLGNKQVLPNGKRMSIKTISDYLQMDIRKVRILVDHHLDYLIKWEYPLRVNSVNKDISILLKIQQPKNKKNILPYKNTGYNL